MMNKIIECVPNFSNGRDSEVLEKIIEPFRGKTDLKLLDYESDKDHNRSVVTVIGEPEELKKAVVEAVGIAAQLIDLRKHEGAHPRMGATDVVPFIPIKNSSMEECIAISNDVGKMIWEQHKIPVFLYEKSATSPARENLSTIRKGQFEGMSEKVKQPEWKPDFGGTEIHQSAGVTAVGCRMPLVAFNVNLATNDLSIADKIAKKVRFIGGGLRFVKAMGVDLAERGIVQVSMNMTDYTKTSLYQSYEMVKMEAKRYGVSVVGTEIVGLTPMEALMDVASYYLQIENFEFNQIIEARLLE
ncbi:glutamate formimidoyltransferase [Treponema pedis]|uniref:glutamate formimidoyltransferase n=1 Tax=Treponema pedis TaxID=409322 RepID=UPI00197F6230|nr:glutamate formimidoyltransferase [Treponema pedis]